MSKRRDIEGTDAFIVDSVCRISKNAERSRKGASRTRIGTKINAVCILN